MIAALWANSNYDGDRGERKQAIEEIERNYEEAVLSIHYGPEALEEEIDENNPFFAPVKRRMAELDKKVQTSGLSVRDVIEEESSDYSKYIDQI